MFLRVIVPLWSLFFGTVLGSFCGKSGVPYSLEVLSNGAPVLGCAQPSCIISALDADSEFQEDSQFLTDAGGQSDGFFRDGDRALKRYRNQAAPKLIANCSGQFNELSCPRRNQWVGGIEYIDHPRQPLILQCCTFEGLRFSQEVGSTTIGPGEAITGGEVVRGGRQISFDVIANVKKVVKQDSAGKVSYEVTVRRMNCLPDPPEPEVELDATVPAEVAKVLSSAKNKELSDKPKEGVKPQSNKKLRDGKQKQKAAKQQAAPTENLPEISGGEGERQTAPRLPPQVQQQSRNNEAIIQPTLRQPDELPSQAQAGQLQQQQQLLPVEPNGQQQQGPQFSAGQQQQFLPQGQGQFPTLAPGVQGQDFQQVQQLQQQQFPAQQPGEAIGVAASQTSSSTAHPLFGGLMSFPTLPAHSFPTLPPHTFPGLPTHSFPTLPPHSFPTLPPHTFPTFAPHTFPSLFGTTAAPTFISSGPATGGSQSSAFAAPSVSAAGGQNAYGQTQSGSYPGQAAGQRIQNPHSAYQQQNRALPTMHHPPPRMAPAMGTILAAMQGERYPVMHPILGVIGYSNSPQPGQRVGRK